MWATISIIAAILGVIALIAVVIGAAFLLYVTSGDHWENG